MLCIRNVNKVNFLFTIFNPFLTAMWSKELILRNDAPASVYEQSELQLHLLVKFWLKIWQKLLKKRVQKWMCSNKKSDLMFLEKKPQWFCKRKKIQSGHHVPKILFACDFRFANSHKQMKNDNSLLFTSLPSGYIVNSRCHITTKITQHFGNIIKEITQYIPHSTIFLHTAS